MWKSTTTVKEHREQGNWAAPGAELPKCHSKGQLLKSSWKHCMQTGYLLAGSELSISAAALLTERLHCWQTQHSAGLTHISLPPAARKSLCSKALPTLQLPMRKCQCWEIRRATLHRAKGRQHLVHLPFKTTLWKQHHARTALPSKNTLSSHWLPLYWVRKTQTEYGNWNRTGREILCTSKYNTRIFHVCSFFLPLKSSSSGKSDMFS